MSEHFPPQSTHISEIEIVLNFLQGVVVDHNAVYVSSPITSGRRYIEWIKAHPTNKDFSGDNQSPEFIANVIDKNLEHAKSVVKKVRTLFPDKILIDPTAVPDVKDWKQGDYRYAWGLIIEKFTNLVVFSDDWQFSSGCVYEYLITINAGIQALDENRGEITVKIAQNLIGKAIETMQAYDLPIEFHKAVFSELSKREVVEVSV